MDYDKYENKVELTVDSITKANLLEARRKVEAEEALLAKLHVEARKAYDKEEARLKVLFKAALIAEYGLTKHPKASRAFEMAWEDGHSGGLESVANIFADLAELLKED